jgi:hypothetical protein
LLLSVKTILCLILSSTWVRGNCNF